MGPVASIKKAKRKKKYVNDYLINFMNTLT